MKMQCNKPIRSRRRNFCDVGTRMPKKLRGLGTITRSRVYKLVYKLYRAIMSRRLKPRNSTAVFISASFPWINTQEWEAVYDWLYSEELKLRKRAVGRVAAWKARASIPLCIELTADLVEGGIWELQHHVRGTTEQPLTLMYSMALTRRVLVHKFGWHI